MKLSMTVTGTTNLSIRDRSGFLIELLRVGRTIKSILFFDVLYSAERRPAHKDRTIDVMVGMMLPVQGATTWHLGALCHHVRAIPLMAGSSLLMPLFKMEWRFGGG